MRERERERGLWIWLLLENLQALLENNCFVLLFQREPMGHEIWDRLMAFLGEGHPEGGHYDGKQILEREKSWFRQACAVQCPDQLAIHTHTHNIKRIQLFNTDVNTSLQSHFTF